MPEIPSLLVIQNDISHLSKLVEDQTRESREHRDKIVKLLTTLAAQNNRMEAVERDIAVLERDTEMLRARLASVSGAICYASGAAAVISAVIAFVASKIF